MKINVADATEIQLDYLVAKSAEKSTYIEWVGNEAYCFDPQGLYKDSGRRLFCPSTSVEQGWDVIEREGISIGIDAEGKICAWAGYASDYDALPKYYGETRLIAAMRCVVAEWFGDEVEIPDNLN